MKIDTVPFGKIQSRVHLIVNPIERNSHILSVARTGGGKSYLFANGIAPLFPYDRIIVIDVKAALGEIRSPWHGFGTDITEIPGINAGTGKGPCANRYRLVVNPDKSIAKTQVTTAFETLLETGHAIVVIDESRQIVEKEQLNLGSQLEKIILLGRGLGLSVWLGAQSLAWTVPSIRDQPGMFLIGSVPQQASEIAKMLGYGRDIIPVLQKVRPRQFLYSDEQGYLGITTMGTDIGHRGTPE
jgi:hypothetical protein